MSKLSEEDKLLFAQATKDVAPLNSTHKVQSQAPLRKIKVRPPILETDITPKFGEVDAVTAHQTLLFHKKGLRLQDLSRLRKGEFSVNWRLDLHGDIEVVAQQRLVQFIQQAYQSQARYALIIHGKGYNSDTGHPLLKNLVNQLLRQLPQVVGFCSALPKDGGTGAVYVLLKAH